MGSWYLSALVGLLALRCGGRLWIARARRSGAFRRRIAVVREHDSPIERVLEGIAADPSLLPVANMAIDFESAEDVARVAAELHRLRGVEQLTLVCRRSDSEGLARLVRELRHMPIEINLVAGPLAGDIPVIGMRAVGSLPATVLLERPMEGPLSAVKDVFDRVISACLLLFIGPLMLLIALAIKLDSRGPVLYRQVRHGFDRRTIEVLKFRTMYHDVCDDPRAERIVQATRDDPRVTRVGRFLRHSNLDELPQLINVLKGDMSLVGPRPHALAHDREYAALIDGYLGRHRVKPGITGWAQVEGYRGETRSLDEMCRRIELDLCYIENWSLALDIKILLKTLLVGFSQDKAY
jgi:putative colanic acid biosynthesis UDP-glucose lipid carrier transferase